MKIEQIILILCMFTHVFTLTLIPLQNSGLNHRDTIQSQQNHLQDGDTATDFSAVLQNGERFDTIVIGGGISGIAAAVQLAKSGQYVAILEANNYLGGRLKTTTVKLSSGSSIQFDEGASWIHGSSEQNPITKLSKKVKGLLMKQTDDEKSEVYGEQGENVDAKVDEAWETYEDLLQKCQSQKPQNSMYSVFEKEGVTNDKYFMFHVANDIQFQTSASISNLAGNGNDDDEFDGQQMLILSGYQRFAQTLVKQADVQVYLNSKVKKVTWNKDTSQIVVGNGIKVYAKNVVISVPIGVLKSKSIQFVPALPAWKSSAIKSIGFGDVCKILVDIPNRNFTDSKNDYIGVVSNDISERGLGTYFLNLKAIAGVSALMTFGLGANAYQAENMTEAQLKEFLAERMSAFVKNEVQPDDLKITRTFWSKNPNFLGAYAYASTTTRPQHWIDMAKPVFASNWYFCGEHTTSKYRGTVHGAYLSGVNTAKAIKEKITEEDWVHPDLI